MDIQGSIEKLSLELSNHLTRVKNEKRSFIRYKIKRRVLIRDPEGRVFTGHAYDISKQGLQFRCSPHVACQLETASEQLSPLSSTNFIVKIALPFMNELAECGIHCSVKSVHKADEETMRVGLSFLFFENNSQMRLDHFIDNLTL